MTGTQDTVTDPGKDSRDPTALELARRWDAFLGQVSGHAKEISDALKSDNPAGELDPALLIKMGSQPYKSTLEVLLADTGMYYGRLIAMVRLPTPI